MFVLLPVLLIRASHGGERHHATEAASPRVSDVRWVVPSRGLPAEVTPMPANNNVAIECFDGRLYMAWRSAPTHFASASAKLFVTSSGDEGRTWTLERAIERGTDVREPHFVVMNDRIVLYFMELGASATAFEPKQAFRTWKSAGGPWAGIEPAPLPERMMIWEIKTHAGAAWMTAYKGNHYSADNVPGIDVYFKKSADGLSWEDVDPARPVVYRGGVSEVAFEFDAEGNLWGVTRNEDGDATGFGSHVVFAEAQALGKWQLPAKSAPFRYDSPRMFRQGEEIYLVARRNVRSTGGGDADFDDTPFDTLGDSDDFLPLSLRRAHRIVTYSMRPKKTSIYKIDRAARAVVWQKDLPSASDTAFASIVEAGPGRFLIANYSNPVAGGGFDWAPDSAAIPEACKRTDHWSWIRGQTSSACGTRIYLATVSFP